MKRKKKPNVGKPPEKNQIAADPYAHMIDMHILMKNQTM